MPSDSTSAKILAAELFLAVRKGLIVGRVILEAENGVPLRYPYDAIPEGTMRLKNRCICVCISDML